MRRILLLFEPRARTTKRRLIVLIVCVILFSFFDFVLVVPLWDDDELATHKEVARSKELQHVVDHIIVSINHGQSILCVCVCDKRERERARNDDSIEGINRQYSHKEQFFRGLNERRSLVVFRATNL